MYKYIIAYDNGQALVYEADSFYDLFDSYTLDEGHIVSITRTNCE